MNTLWLASRHGKRFVLKGLSEEFRTSTPHLELLRKEFRIASELDHPGIVRTLDYGQSDSIGEYIQMEYVLPWVLLETKFKLAANRRVFYTVCIL